jgi:hypothetical protein
MAVFIITVYSPISFITERIGLPVARSEGECSVR